MTHVNRRNFLSLSGAAAAAITAGGASLTSFSALAAEETKQAEAQATGSASALAAPARYRFSLAAYSYRSLLGGARGNPKPTLTIEDFVTDCARAGFDGVELTSYYFPKDVTPEFLRAVKAHCFKLGMDITGTAVGNDFTVPKGEKRDAQIADVKRWIDNAEILGAPQIRIFAGSLKPGQTEAEAQSLVIEAVKECCDYAGDHGVFLALENHGGITATPEGLLKLYEGAKHPWLGITFDSGNFHTPDPYADLEKIAPYAINAQVKVVITRGEKGAKKEESDYARIAKMLRAANYRGYIVLEYEEPGNPRTECPMILEQLRKAFS
jgi:sugar phosphate isomerase/epimerase